MTLVWGTTRVRELPATHTAFELCIGTATAAVLPMLLSLLLLAKVLTEAVVTGRALAL